ncbi:hypothetical protein DFP72DRAFT_30136 [Ephemerocybe angulata]|uniref:Uncharacterized protein n=1 Tax=Ephemerocybe angulata TaxID=980116 RepID=A0A8H6MFC7_9AGAR|nr:hypothetical protein DFP72DRAFT_30136 [Tulosesus angulatus]
MKLTRILKCQKWSHPGDIEPWPVECLFSFLHGLTLPYETIIFVIFDPPRDRHPPLPHWPTTVPERADRAPTACPFSGPSPRNSTIRLRSSTCLSTRKMLHNALPAPRRSSSSSRRRLLVQWGLACLLAIWFQWALPKGVLSASQPQITAVAIHPRKSHRRTRSYRLKIQVSQVDLA